MQDPLKTNKPFQTLYAAAVQDRHSKLVTPQNIDDLILKLNQIEKDRPQSTTSADRKCINLAHATEKQDHQFAFEPAKTLFTDKYMQHTTLPANSNSTELDKRRRRPEHDIISWQNGNHGKRYTSRLAPIDKSKLIKSIPAATTTNNNKTVPTNNNPAATVHKHNHSLPSVDSFSATNPPKINEITLVIPSATMSHTHADKGSDNVPFTGHNSAVSSFSICKPKPPPPLSASCSSHPLLCLDPEAEIDNDDDVEASDDGRDSGWTDSDHWLMEEEDVLSDIDDDATGSILTSGMEELESDHDVWELGREDLAVSDPPIGISGCGPVRSFGSVSTLVMPLRTLRIGERGGAQATPPLTPSLFPGQTPTIHFPLANEKYERLRPEQRSLLKWKMSPITPNVVKHVIARVGFKATNGNRWIGYWGRHMKSEGFRSISQDQKVNHFPGSFNLGRKDRLWRNLFRMQAQHGRKEFDFIPETYVLPNDMRNFKRAWDSNGPNNKWIIKPPASARGIGIKVINKLSQIPKKRAVIVQRYISNPFLINGAKFDLRVYVYVKSFDPLIIYVYRDGLVRFATVKYSKSSKKLSNRYMHLTNYSVNKHSSLFVSNSDETQCYGHKWGLLALWGYMDRNLSIDPGPVWERIKDVVIKTVISCEDAVTSLVKANVRDSSSVHELFGFDIMLDKQLKPWLLEVNVSPSLHSNSSLDLNIKEVMMRDLFNICGFKLPSTQNENSRSRTHHAALSPEDRIKHSRFTQRKLTQQQQIDAVKILDNLSETDCAILMDIEDQFSRRGSFIRVFPRQNAYSVYAKYFHIQRYYNILIDQWIIKHCGRLHHQGISELTKCYEKHQKTRTNS